jgi:hypothetical protein
LAGAWRASLRKLRMAVKLLKSLDINEKIKSWLNVRYRLPKKTRGNR